MVRRLLEADYHRHAARPSRHQIAFWLREIRTTDLLIALCRRYPGTARRMTTMRAALRPARRRDAVAVEHALDAEQDLCRAKDREYWKPLRAELERWRHARSRKGDV